MRWNGWIGAVACLLTSAVALADANDFRLTKLGNPSPGTNFKDSANADFRAFARSLGAAVTSANLMPPASLGHAGFAVNAELSIVPINNKVVMPTEQAFSGTLLVPAVHVRKGLPYSFELGTRIGWIGQSRIAAATAEGKWAFNEGYSYLPDFAIRGFATRLLNTRDFDLTSVGSDVGVGKRFPLGGMVTLTPYGGWSLGFTSASSATIDFDPGRSYPASVAKPTAQLESTASFDPVELGSNTHNRLYAGLRFIGGALQLGAEGSVAILGSISSPDAANPGKTVLRRLPEIWAGNVTLGLDF